MALSKRLRFEILRRDGHACRYCGRTAPDVKLHIDHVIPQVLGGADEPTNLVTACHECNGGKTSSAPDQQVVADVSEKAIQWREAITRAADEMRQVASGKTDLHNAVLDAWPSYAHKWIPRDFGSTIDQFTAAGLPDDVIVEMAHYVANKPGVDDDWRYFCGCCWAKIRQLQERALELVKGQSDDWPPEGEPTSRTVLWDKIHYRLEGIFRIYDEVRGSVSRHYAIGMFRCGHRIEWPIRAAVKGDNLVRDEPCLDPKCLAGYASFIYQERERIGNVGMRDGNVMDAADELELIDG